MNTAWPTLYAQSDNQEAHPVRYT